MNIDKLQSGIIQKQEQLKKISKYDWLFYAPMILALLLLVTSPFFLFRFALSENTSAMIGGLVIMGLLIVWMIIFGTIHFRKKSKLMSALKVDKADMQKELSEANRELRDKAYKRLSSLFDVTVEQIDFDLTDVLKSHPELRSCWWNGDDKIAVIEEALRRKYKVTYTAIEKADLQIENLKLQNEGLSIDNDIKRPWKCPYCGNMNHGADMSCLGCQAQKPEGRG